MSNFIEGLSTKDKVIFLGGGALVVVFLVKTVTGTSSSSPATQTATPNQTDASIQTANGAANAEQAFESQVGASLTQMGQAQTDAQAKQTAGISDMFTSFKQAQDSANAALQGSIATSAASQNSTISTMQALINQMARTPVYGAPVVAPVVQSSGGVASGGFSSSQTAYNTIGGGVTASKPSTTTLTNGNTISYDNGPHGWTEYNSSGTAVRSGTASPY